MSIQPLRKFACEVRKVMESYPSGLCFSNFAPAFRSCLGYECVVGHYGNFSKLSQLFEAIPDTAKVCVSVCLPCMLCCLFVFVILCMYMCVFVSVHLLYCTFIQLSTPLQVIGEGMAKKVYLIYSKITSNGMKEKT